MRTTMILSLALVAGCSRSERAPQRDSDVSLHPTLANATQTDLAHEIDQADRRGTWHEVKTRWQGQRLTWTVTRQKSLCSSPSLCNVAAFPIQRPALVGWMPGLEMSAAEYAKVEAGCGAVEQCELVIEGTLSQLALSAEQPTSVHFSDVHVKSAHTKS